MISLLTLKDIKTNSRRGSSLVNPITSKFLEIDVWVPDRNICFEFQVRYFYHYKHTGLQIYQLDLLQIEEQKIN